MLRWDEVEKRRLAEQQRSFHVFDDDDSGDNESVLSDDGEVVQKGVADKPGSASMSLFARRSHFPGIASRPGSIARPGYGHAGALSRDLGVQPFTKARSSKPAERVKGWPWVASDSTKVMSEQSDQQNSGHRRAGEGASTRGPVEASPDSAAHDSGRDRVPEGWKPDNVHSNHDGQHAPSNRPGIDAVPGRRWGGSQHSTKQVQPLGDVSARQGTSVRTMLFSSGLRETIHDDISDNFSGEDGASFRSVRGHAEHVEEFPEDAPGFGEPWGRSKQRGAGVTQCAVGEPSQVNPSQAGGIRSLFGSVGAAASQSQSRRSGRPAGGKRKRDAESRVRAAHRVGPSQTQVDPDPVVDDEAAAAAPRCAGASFLGAPRRPRSTQTPRTRPRKGDSRPREETTVGATQATEDIADFSDEEAFVPAPSAAAPATQHSISGGMDDSAARSPSAVAATASGVPFLKGLNASAANFSQWEATMPKRGPRRSKGELGAAFERFCQRHAKEVELFRHELKTEGNVTCVTATGRPWTVMIVAEQYLTNVYVGVARVLCDDPVTLLLLWHCAVKAELGLGVGAVVQVFQPWETLQLPSSAHPVVLCSAKCIVLSHIDSSAAGSARAVEDTLETLRAEHGSYLPPTLVSIPSTENRGQCIPIWSLPVTSFDPTEEHPTWGKVEKIAALDPWQGEASVLGTVLGAHARVLALSRATMPDDVSERMLCWMEATRDSPDYRSFETLEPNFWVADAAGNACKVVVPLPLAEENPWRRILLCEAQGLQVHLGRLTVRSARDLHSPPDTLAGSWSGTKTHEAVLVASQQSTARLHDPTIEPAPFLPPQQPAPQLSADTPLPLAKLFGAAGDAAPPSRATVLVEVLHIAPPHAGGRYGGPHQLWMCIRDASLDAADGVPTNALLTVSDLQQAMGAFIALKPGDALLVRAAAVHAGPACLSSPPVNRLCLAADADSLIMRAVPAGAVGAGRDTAGFEVPLRAVAPGPLLELLGSDAASAEGKAKQKRGAARLGHGEASPRDSWVTFQGARCSPRRRPEPRARVQVDVCEVCLCESVRSLPAPDDSSQDSGGYLCERCDHVGDAPLLVLSPCRVTLRQGPAVLSLWLRGPQAVQLLLHHTGAVAAAHAPRALRGKHIAGVAAWWCAACGGEGGGCAEPGREGGEPHEASLWSDGLDLHLN